MTAKLRVASSKLRVPSQVLAGARPALPHSRNSQLATRYAVRGFTLVELLVTMVIIAIISAAILGTAGAAMDAARRSRTQTVINRIHLLLMERWGDYQTRRIDISNVVLSQIDQIVRNQVTPIGSLSYSEGNRLRGRYLADARLLALRELMKMEMPNRWSEIGIVDNNGNLVWPISQSAIPPNPSVLSSRPALANQYFQQLKSLTADDVERVLTNQSAECLYMTIMKGTGDGEARSQFTEQDIGDTDGDGAPEFLDGWGHAIQWIRWPSGYVEQSPLMSGDGDGDHDPFDLYRRDFPGAPRPLPSLYPSNMRQAITQLANRNNQALSDNDKRKMAFRLIPLIYSAGPDAEVDTEGEILNKGYLFLDSGDVATLDPYFITKDGFQAGFPDPESDAWQDNITNHTTKY